MFAFVSTLPKSGTHLLAPILKGLGFKRAPLDRAESDTSLGKSAIRANAIEAICAKLDQATTPTFTIDHYPYSRQLADALAARSIRTVVLLRDPRDFVVSLSHYAMKRPAAGLRQLAEEATSPAHLQMLLCAPRTYGAGTSPFDKYTRLTDGWVRDGRCLVLRFEQIVGPRGGGSTADQIASGLRLRDWFGIDADESTILRVMTKGFDTTTAVFRRGQIKAWREEMASNLADRLWEEKSDLFRRWGYTRDGELAPPPANGL